MRILVSFLLFMNTVIFFGCGNSGRATTMVGAVEDPTVEQPAPIIPPEGMVLIPASRFQMGSNDPDAFDDEQPVHTVYIDAFYIDKYEVTVGEYKDFIHATEYSAPDWSKIAEDSPTDQHPIIHVSWHDAMAYAKWAGKRLPTEAEWEKAARGGLMNQKYPQGSSIDASKANYGLDVGGTVPVGQYPANDYDLYDMAGNVWEWCSDPYDDVEDSRVLRGGSWLDTARFVRVSVRGWSTQSFTSAYIGFRCAKSP